MELGATPVEMGDRGQLAEDMLDPDLGATLQGGAMSELQTQWFLSGYQVLAVPLLRWRRVLLCMSWHLHVRAQMALAMA
eukprot:4030984-Pyramimonas_sp.AAC.1